VHKRINDASSLPHSKPGLVFVLDKRFFENWNNVRRDVIFLEFYIDFLILRKFCRWSSWNWTNILWKKRINRLLWSTITYQIISPREEVC